MNTSENLSESTTRGRAKGARATTNRRAETVLVTGATAGIGRDAVLHLAGRGHRVIATGRRASALDELRNEASGAGLTIETLVLDVDDRASLETARVAVGELTNGAGVDVLVNNAGYATVGAMAELSDAALRAQFETNVFGLMAVTRAFLPGMIERRRGRVLNVSSVSGRMPAPILGAYHASKYALEALSDALRMELAAFGVDVVLIEPGTIRTSFAARVLSEMTTERPASTRYGSAYARADLVKERFESAAAPVRVVSRAIARAIEARRPCSRYIAPRRFWLALFIVSVLPTRLVDLAMRWAFGLTRRELLAPAP